jgi:hypothetical protein
MSRFFRTARPAHEPHFGLFSVSLGALSPTQPNHGHFGTDPHPGPALGDYFMQEGLIYEGGTLAANCAGGECVDARLDIVRAAIRSWRLGIMRRHKARAMKPMPSTITW